MRDEMNRGKSKTIVIFVAVILILAAVLVYVLVIRPSISGYVVKVQAAEDVRVLNAIVATVAQTGYVQIPVVGTNRSMVLYEQSYIQQGLPQLCAQLNSTNATK